MNMVSIFVIGSALLFIAALGAYAWRLVARVRRLERTRAEAATGRRRQLVEGLDVLVQSLLQGQINMTEACIRIRYHLEQLSGDTEPDPELAVFRQVSEQTAHIPTHDEYRNLDSRAQWLFDQQRVAVENDHRLQVIEACQALKLRIDAGSL